MIDLALNPTVTYKTLLQKIGFPLFVLAVVTTGLDQWITGKMEILLAGREGLTASIWLLGLTSLSLSLIGPLLGILLALSAIRQESILFFLKQHFQQNLIEEMRVFGWTLLWFLLFILPGFVRMLRYLFVPFVVTLDPAYQRGEKDALQESLKISRGRLLKLLGLAALFFLILPALLTLLDQWRGLWQTPLPALGICLIEMLLNLCFIYLLLGLYQKGVAHESVVSMEGN